jgi:hypothetical protein
LLTYDCCNVVTAELDAGVAVKDHTGFDASVETAERVCQEVRGLLAKTHLTLERMRDVSILELTSITMAGIIEALAPKEDGEDPLIAAVRR